MQATIFPKAYLTTMCHEIRTPLTAILGVSEILDNQICNILHNQCAEILHDSAIMLKGLIDELLDISLIESDILALKAEPFNLRKVLSEVTNIIHPIVTQKGLKFAVEIGELPEALLGDSLRIKQIILNLLNNAAKFTEKGFIGLSVIAEPGINGYYDVLISVKDSGIGIAPEKFAQIFEKYNQGDETVNRRYGGLGLGLNICLELARKMNGKIWVKSTVGKGSCFTAALQLPVANISPQAIAA